MTNPHLWRGDKSLGRGLGYIFQNRELCNKRRVNKRQQVTSVDVKREAGT